MSNPSTRREWIKKAGALALGTMFAKDVFAATAKNNPRILLVSGWQDVNIGDIAHTPGFLHVLETFLPEAQIVLWKKSGYNKEVAKIYKSYFPEVKVLYGNINEQKEIDNPAIYKAFDESDILVHGSGPLLVAADHLDASTRYCGKPFGIFGVTLQNPSSYHQEILKQAAFIYTRETKSIEHLKKVGIEGNHVKFVPDATFFCNVRDNQKAASFLKSNKLEDKKFICVIPRLRYTPYHLIYPGNGWSDEKIKSVEETNDKYKEADHAKLREAMIRWVRETGNKVLVCPEMTYEVDIMDELLIEPLPDDIKPYVLKRGYWMTGEAASVYAKAHSLLSFECHSPILALYNGTPAFYLRQPEDTIKGQMYYDLDYDEWVFEIMETAGKQIADKLMEVYTNYDKAREMIDASNKNIRNIYENAVEVLKT
ncbi:MAG: polysaccharide pyruvyl transferase family protein [Candidatus Bathyarchaeota archaeon]|nr:polysaccharide pyruvyl transferase family protein [Candidatus Bathyarchaeota archaeon]